MDQPAKTPAGAKVKEEGPQEQSLYEVSKKIYPRAVSGTFATWRWILVWFTQLIFYGLPWLSWNNRQAVLFDLVHRKFYIFGLVLWPQDVIYLAILLIISAYALFFFTAVAGRLWCGYACPQTVYTEIYMWLEKLVEGDRNKRMRLDNEPMSARKLRLKVIKQVLWVGLGLWTGFTFVGYFSPIKELWGAVWTLGLGPWETFWILFYGFATWGNAGYMREQVCKYMCPYARFQGVMFDPDTLIISYDPERGEPRGPRAKKIDPKSKGLGACVDCGFCVQVCPTGIDIREGLQYECIGCSACIDACDQVMDKFGYERGLIRYSTENAMKDHFGTKTIVEHIFRPRIYLYGGILVAICLATVVALSLRIPLKVDVIRDRASLGQEVDDGLIENAYRLQIMNVTEQPRRFAISVTGLKDIKTMSSTEVDVPPATTHSVNVQVRAAPDGKPPGSYPIEFTIRALDDAGVLVHEKSKFLIP